MGMNMVNIAGFAGTPCVRNLQTNTAMKQKPIHKEFDHSRKLRTIVTSFKLALGKESAIKAPEAAHTVKGNTANRREGFIPSNFMSLFENNRKTTSQPQKSAMATLIHQKVYMPMIKWPLLTR